MTTQSVPYPLADYRHSTRLPSLSLEPVGDKPLKSVTQTHGYPPSHSISVLLTRTKLVTVTQAQMDWLEVRPTTLVVSPVPS